MRHFLDTQDFSKAELLAMIDLAFLLKEADKQRCLPPILAGASLGMIFEEPSTRTRISFEVAMTKLGGHAIYLKPGEIHLGVRENIKDTSQVISRMVDAIEARTLKHETLMGLAQHATVPVINGLTDYNHPTQVLCDVMTIIEHKSPGKRLEDVKVTFIGDATNVCSSLLMICTKLGMHFTHCAPNRYQSPKAWQDIGAANCLQSSGTMTLTDDPIAAVKDADFVYTDLWWWVGQEAEIPDRRAAFMPDYQVNEALFAKAPAHACMMHCLPASRGVEATDGVLDHARSIIYDQSENRLHMEKAILVTFIAPRLKHPEPEQKEWHAGRIASFLSQPILKEKAS